MVQKGAKRGRPPRHEGERLSKSRTFRVRPHLDELLVTAAAKAGRSVSEEIEYRLDRSFYEDALPARMAETMTPLVPLVEQAARAGGEAALKVHYTRLEKLLPEWASATFEGEVFRHFLATNAVGPETEAERQERLTDPDARIPAQVRGSPAKSPMWRVFEGAKQGRKGLAFEPLRKLLDAFGDVHGRPANTHAELSTWALESPQGKAALDKIMEEERAAFNKMIQGDLTPEKK